MYISEIRVKNLRCLEDVTLTFPKDERGGWYVIAGELGTGKTTLLQAVSLAIAGPRVTADLMSLEKRTRLIRLGNDHATAELVLSSGETLSLYFSREAVPEESRNTVEGHATQGAWSTASSTPLRALAYGPVAGAEPCGGPCGSPHYLLRSKLIRQFLPIREQSHHAPLHGRDEWLLDIETVLWSLLVDENDPGQPDAGERELRENLTRALNKLCEPLGLSVASVTPRGVLYRACGIEVPVTREYLSRSVRGYLNLVGDVLVKLHLSGLHGGDLETLEGVVLIDDADLLPPGARLKLRELLPRVQFIVTSTRPGSWGAAFMLRRSGRGRITAKG